MSPSGDSLHGAPGTYALLLELPEPAVVRVGHLGWIRFDSRFYLYFGSAFGPGGLEARLKHHLHPARRPHWHIDHLRRVARVREVWHGRDPERWECTWAQAASRIRGGSLVPRFGASDCRCRSHLLAIDRVPSLSTFRRRLDALRPGCGTIRRLGHPRPC